MITEYPKRPDLPFRWIDVVLPTREELQKIAAEHGLHSRMIEDCLDPEHLPKYESLNEKGFLITRAFDRHAPPDADTAQALTRKVAIIFGPDIFITIHRAPQEWLEDVRSRWESRAAANHQTSSDLLADCLNAALSSFEEPLEQLENSIDTFEQTLFANRDVIAQLKAIHSVKRRASAFKRILWHTTNTIQRLQPQERVEAPLFQDLKENAEAYFVYADELLEELHALLNTQLSMASHRTNEIVRVLTVFSVFFLPLTFIVGIYGMNFRHMPELAWTWGYPLIIGIMALISFLIFLWFRKKGFLR